MRVFSSWIARRRSRRRANARGSPRTTRCSRWTRVGGVLLFRSLLFDFLFVVRVVRGVGLRVASGVAGAPVELVQLAFGANRARSGRARAVILDCPALLGDAADASLAEATARFFAEVFSRAVIVGFGAAGDVERLFASYPDRFRVPVVPVPGPMERSEPPPLRSSGARDPSPFPDATCACAKDAAAYRWASRRRRRRRYRRCVARYSTDARSIRRNRRAIGREGR